MLIFAKRAVPIFLLISQVFCGHSSEEDSSEERPSRRRQEWRNLPDLSQPIFQSEDSRLTNFNLDVVMQSQPIIDAFLNCPKQQFWELDNFVSQRISHSLHHDVLRLALAHRLDLGGFHSQSIAQPLPPVQGQDEDVVIVDYPMIDNDPENRISYYREDLALNLFHIIWHLVYPIGVSVDRKGETFGYMHQQLIARYNFERFSANLPRTLPLHNLREPMVEGYTHRLFGLVDKNYPNRPPNMILQNLNRVHENVVVNISQVEEWRDNLLKAIEDGFVFTNASEKIILDEETGPEIIWNILEANELSINKVTYGSIHSRLHLLTSRVTDPLYINQSPEGLVGTHSCALRDPVFYRLHLEIDDIAAAFLDKLPPYTRDQLNFNGVTVRSAEVIVDGLGSRNMFHTHLAQTDVLLREGIDFDSNKIATVRYSHTQHQPFTYRIKVENQGQQRSGTCRIFLAPKFNESGLPFVFNDQRKFFIELDKFYVSLRPGQNTIERKSVDSTVTIPPENTFYDTTASSMDPNVFLGCGYPHSLLIPRGNTAGYQAQLFVIITDYEQDKVEGVDMATVGDDNALSICGLKGSKNPDKKPMGYPFNRVARPGVTSTKSFLTPNMALTDVVIRHEPVVYY